MLGKVVRHTMRELESHARTVVFPFSGGQIGGSHISTMFLADVLRDQHGYFCVFICPPKTALETLATERGHMVWPGPPAAANLLTEVVGGLSWRASLLRTNKPRLVHCNDFPTFTAWAPLAPVTRIPIVYHHRSLNAMTWKKRIVLRQADHVFCISDATFENVSFLPSGQRTLLLNPFPLAIVPDRRIAARARILAELGLSDDVELIGFVGNFWQRKRPQMFIDVAARLANVRPKARFVMFGRAGEYSEDEIRARISALGLSQRIRVLGFRLPPEDNLAALDLLLATAVNEPFGRTLVEAMLCRTPFVATDHAGHAEIQRRWQGGLLVHDTESVDAFVEASVRALDAAPSLVLTEPQLERLVEDLSPSNHARSVSHIYSRLLQGV